MGRKSKRIHSTAETSKVMELRNCQGSKYYKAGVYARLSSDQKLSKFESVEAQIEIAKKYVENWNRQNNDKIEVIGNYIDMGKTGTNFEREGFKNLMKDVRKGDINCIIVKDLSRFGRNYLEAGNYIEKIFPFLGVRFIAVSDGYDTGAESNSVKQVASEIKNLVNDMYAKDISAKSRLSLKQRREEGSYVGGQPPYGYESFYDGRIRKLRPDKNTAEIVRSIYQKFVEMENCLAVADYLNIRRINPPDVYHKTKEVYCPDGISYKGWSRGAVERVVKSDTYVGRLVQGKTTITAKKEENRIRKPEDEWVKKENTHEALISLDLYEQAAEICRRIRERTNSHEHSTQGCPIEENIFDKVLYCGVCGKKMTRNSKVQKNADSSTKRRDGYFCMNGGSTGADCCPVPNRISKMEIEDILFVLIQNEVTIKLKRQKEYVDQGKIIIERKKKDFEQLLRQLERQAATLSDEESRKYMEYREGRLDQEEYVCYRLWRDECLSEIEKQKCLYKKEIMMLDQKGKTYLKALRSLIKINDHRKLTKELVEALIEKIYVYPGKRVEVVFSYSDLWMGEVR